MILGHSEIGKLVETEKLLEDVELKNIGGAGVDVRIGNAYKIRSGARLGVEERVLPQIEKIDGENFLIKPGEYILVETIEKVNMPNCLAARMLPRSTLQRSGVYLFTALIDPGYKGRLVFGMKNLGDYDFELEKGARIAQIIFERVEGETQEYSGKYQGGKIV